MSLYFLDTNAVADCVFRRRGVHERVGTARLAGHKIGTGIPVQTVDLMVAAIALTLGGCTVVTSDSDLSVVPGLHVENWVTDT